MDHVKRVECVQLAGAFACSCFRLFLRDRAITHVVSSPTKAGASSTHSTRFAITQAILKLQRMR
jgi:hypothetical protein